MLNVVAQLQDHASYVLNFVHIIRLIDGITGQYVYERNIISNIKKSTYLTHIVACNDSCITGRES